MEIGPFQPCLRGSVQSGYLVPDLESPLAFGTVLPCLQPMATGTKVFSNRTKGREETLGMAR